VKPCAATARRQPGCILGQTRQDRRATPDDLGTRAIVNKPEGEGFVSEVDASAGGFDPPEAFVYARFTPSGLERVEIGDLAALGSTKWDLAFRRYLVRLNSGVSGPSCVVGAALPAGTEYDGVGAVPAGVDYRAEAYYDQACQMVVDGSGLNSPGTVLSSYWKYAGCVQMTGRVYLLRLADGREIKLTVTAFYAPQAQETCNSTGAVPMGTPGARISLRWEVLAP
jgi:hypothetical protein